jgi:hypothetical protein
MSRVLLSAIRWPPALAELGLSLNAPLLVTGQQQLDEVIADRLAGVPELLRSEAQSRMQAAVVFLPWLTGRKVVSGESIRQTQRQ